MAVGGRRERCTGRAVRDIIAGFWAYVVRLVEVEEWRCRVSNIKDPLRDRKGEYSERMNAFYVLSSRA